MYRCGPLVRGYLQSLGVAPRDVVFSPPTSPALWRAGAGRGATDPCFPVKVTLAHVEHLVSRVHDAGAPLDALYVPRATHAATPVRHTLDCASCPVVAAAPAMVRAGYVLADDALAPRGIRLIDEPLTLSDPSALRAQLFSAFGELLAVSRAQSDAAVACGLAAMRALDTALQTRAAAVLARLAREPALGAVLVVARPYHADPGINHRVGEELAALGYPVLTVRSLPRDEAVLSRWMRAPLAAGTIEDVFDVRDLLPESDNSGASERLWAARIAAGHGRLGVLDLGSFKCAQDAPTYAPMRALFADARVVRCNLHDLDETRPAVSLRMRLRTFAHALRGRGMAPWSS
jgi:predicted nucleotide-binding protein (sugar kinase/HSP70/actin superfamily)